MWIFLLTIVLLHTNNMNLDLKLTLVLKRWHHLIHYERHEKGKQKEELTSILALCLAILKAESMIFGINLGMKTFFVNEFTNKDIPQ